MSRLIYELAGCRGRHIKVFDDKVILSVNVGVGSLLTGNFSDGEKTIYYTDCIGVQFKKAGLQIGYLQFETASRLMNHSSNNFFNENTFTWDAMQECNKKMEEVSQYVKGRVGAYKSGQYVQSRPQIAINSNATTESLLKRTQLLLEDKEWETANAYCENVLDREPENSTAYLYKFMAELRVSHYEELRDQPQPFDSNTSYQKVMRFADEDLKQTLQSYIAHIKNRNENKRLEDLYRDACARMEFAGSVDEYETAASLFNSIANYKDSAELRKKCLSRIENIRIADLKQKKKRKMTILLSIPVILLLMFGAYRVKLYLDAPAKDALASTLVETSWRYHWESSYDSDEFTNILKFQDKQNLTLTIDFKVSGEQRKHEYPSTWEVTSISSDKATIKTIPTSSQGSPDVYQVSFENKNGTYQISKIVDVEYDNIYYPMR